MSKNAKVSETKYVTGPIYMLRWLPFNSSTSATNKGLSLFQMSMKLSSFKCLLFSKNVHVRKIRTQKKHAKKVLRTL